jgi:transcription elongation factor Elf1
MGKRKSSAKAPPKKARPKLETTFACPFCNADKSVGCELDRETNVGAVRCTQCKATWTTKIHQLSEPIDVYRCALVAGLVGQEAVCSLPTVCRPYHAARLVANASRSSRR